MASPKQTLHPIFLKKWMGKIEDPRKLNFFTPPTALERSRSRGGRYACAGGRGGISLFSRGTKASLVLMFTSTCCQLRNFRSIVTNPARPISYN